MSGPEPAANPKGNTDSRSSATVTLAEIGLYELRRSLERSPTNLAAELGISQPAVSQLEHGDDVATTGAIYGQIAGAHYGAETIPTSWRAKLTMATEITSLADHLHDQTPSNPRAAGTPIMTARMIIAPSVGIGV